jgi:hypothetical protein
LPRPSSTSHILVPARTHLFLLFHLSVDLSSLLYVSCPPTSPYPPPWPQAATSHRTCGTVGLHPHPPPPPHPGTRPPAPTPQEAPRAPAASRAPSGRTATANPAPKSTAPTVPTPTTPEAQHQHCTSLATRSPGRSSCSPRSRRASARSRARVPRGSTTPSRSSRSRTTLCRSSTSSLRPHHTHISPQQGGTPCCSSAT